TANTGLSVSEGTSATITSSQLAASGDAGDPASELVYTVTAAPTHGTLKLNNVATSTFTQDDINTGKVSYTQDGSDNNDSFAFSVTAAPAHRTLKLNGIATSTFTQDDINTGKVSYTHDGTDNNDSFGFSVADSPGAAATGTFSITFTEVAATITANTGLTLGEGATRTITSSKLAATSHAGDPASELLYTVTAAPTHGTLKLSANALAVNGTCTQD